MLAGRRENTHNTHNRLSVKRASPLCLTRSPSFSLSACALVSERRNSRLISIGTMPFITNDEGLASFVDQVRGPFPPRLFFPSHPIVEAHQ